MKKIFSFFNSLLQRNILILLLVVYVLATLFPQPGIFLRNLSFGHLKWPFGSEIHLSFSLLLLSFLLFSAGFSVQLEHLKKTIRVPLPLIFGILANTLIPIILIQFFSIIGKMLWHNPEEIQKILVGLAIIASMPIAGSSTAWTQKASGNIGLILGLVITSTLASPLLTPWVLRVMGKIITGSHSEKLHSIASGEASGFLILAVVIPSLAGVLWRVGVRNRFGNGVAPYLKFASLVVLLVLNYSNAAVTLPQVFLNPDYDLIVLIVIVTLVLCSFSFYMGWFFSKLMKLPFSDRVAFAFGLGMNNNGTGLVLVSLTLQDHPAVMLPIIFYNLGQHLVAGIFDTFVLKALKRKYKFSLQEDNSDT